MAIKCSHYNNVIMGAMASQIISLTNVYSTVYSGADQTNIKAPYHWPVWCFHLMTSSCRLLFCRVRILRMPECNRRFPPWCRHDVETLPILLAICEGNSRVDTLTKIQQVWTLIFDVNMPKQSSCRLFETPWCPRDVAVMKILSIISNQLKR